MNNFSGFRLNFSWKVSKMHYLATNFQKSPSAEGSPLPAPLNLRFWWPEVTWFGEIVVFQTDYDEVELQKISVMASSLCPRKTSPNWRQKIFPFGPLPTKISGYAMLDVLLHPKPHVNIWETWHVLFSGAFKLKSALNSSRVSSRSSKNELKADLNRSTEVCMLLIAVLVLFMSVCQLFYVITTSRYRLGSGRPFLTVLSIKIW